MAKTTEAKFLTYLPALLSAAAFLLMYLFMERNCYPHQLASVAAVGAAIYATAIYVVWRMAVAEWRDRNIGRESYSEKPARWFSGYWFHIVLLAFLSYSAVIGFDKFLQASAPFVNCGERISQVPGTPSQSDPDGLRELAEGVYGIRKWSGFLKPSEVAEREGATIMTGTYLNGPIAVNGYSYYPGNLTIGSSGSVAEFSWSGEILVEGNVTVVGNMAYSSGSALKILAWGNVSIEPDVSETVWTWFVRGAFFLTNDYSEKPKPHVHFGRIMADGPSVIQR